MAKIIKQREFIEAFELHHEFDYEDEIGSGFSFVVDASDNLVKPCDRSVANFAACKTGDVNGQKVVDRGVSKWDRSYTIGPILKCDCGREIELHGFTNECDCGADYNSGGQRLAPREQWGEETGESLSDILRIP